MRIKNVQLENYLGLLEGTGRSTLAVDFEPAHEAGYQRTLLFGRNGSGKSSMLNALSPFPSQGDDRSSIIVSGRAGRKIITFDRHGTEVKCDIRWSAKGKASCFMYLDGATQPLELTAKGNIGEYLKAVEQELGVTQDFLKLGRVGTRVNSFLDLGPGPRKNFIGQFLPELEEWAVMHKNVSKRVAQLKAQLQGMQVELERIEPREELENALRHHAADMTRLKEELRRVDTQLGTAQGILDEILPKRTQLLQESGVTDDGSSNPIAYAMADALDAVKAAEAQLAKLLADRPRLQNYAEPTVANQKLAEIETTIARSTGELDILRGNVATARTRLDVAIQNESTTQAQIKRAQSSTTQLAALQLQAVELEVIVARLEKQGARELTLPEGLTYDMVKAATTALSDLAGEIADLNGAFPTPEVLRQALEHNMDGVALRTLLSKEATTLRELTQRLDTARSRIGTIEAQVSFHNRFAGMHCNDPRCPYENHIGQFATAAQELESKRDEVRKLEERIGNATAVQKDMERAIIAAKAVGTAHERLQRHRPVLVAAQVWPLVGAPAAFHQLVAAGTIEAEQLLHAKHLLDKIALQRDLAEADRTLAGVHARIADVQALQAATEQLAASLTQATAAVAVAREEYDALVQRRTATENGIEAQRQARVLISQLVQYQTAIANHTATANRLAGHTAALAAIVERWELIHEELATAGEARTTVSTALSAADATLANSRLRLSRRNEYEQRLAAIQGQIERAQLVADACHPARGAPVEFLRDFLDVTRDTVNELLDLALQGEFRIGFSLTDSEFRIPVAKGSGRIIPDVTEASEGQLALAKTILSLALVKQTVRAQGGYNVICFDEIDGMLDRERNRERFADIVDQLSAELGLEQLLMISHNDSFVASPAGVILFPGHAMPDTDPIFLENKVILARFD